MRCTGNSRCSTTSSVGVPPTADSRCETTTIGESSTVPSTGDIIASRCLFFFLSVTVKLKVHHYRDIKLVGKMGGYDKLLSGLGVGKKKTCVSVKACL